MKCFKYDNLSLIFCILIILFAGTVCLFKLDNSLSYGGDDSQLVFQAKAIIDGTISDYLYKMAFIRDNSSEPFMQSYSWGIPFMLAPIYKFFGLNYFCFKILMLLFFIGTIVILYRELNQRIGLFGAVLFTLLFSLSPNMTEFVNVVMKDIPYLFVSFFAVVVMSKIINEDNLNKKINKCVLLSILLTLCLLFRENGFITLFIIIVSQIYGIRLLMISLKNDINNPIDAGGGE